MKRRVALLLLVALIAVVAIPASRTTLAATTLRMAGALSLRQDAKPQTCREVDPSWSELALTLPDESLAVGRVFSLSDGTLSALVLVAAIDDQERATALDFAASIRLTSAIVRSEAGGMVIESDPPSRNGSGLRATNDEAIQGIALCYRIVIPDPPAPAQPTATPGGEGSVEPTLTRSPSRTPTSTSFDLESVQAAAAVATDAAIRIATADARSALLEATITAQAGVDATRQAAEIAANAGATESAVTLATANAAAAATSSAQATEIAVARSTAASAEQTAAALQATIVAPTVAPTSTPEPTAQAGTAVLSAASDAEFAAFPAADGWKVDSGLVADGGNAGWIELPPTNLTGDYAVEAEIQAGLEGECPRNFGIAIRGSGQGYDAGGIEWACDSDAHIWAGQETLVAIPYPLDTEWHTYRVEVLGNQVTLRVDGVIVLSVTSPSVPPGSINAIWSDGVSLRVRAVRVLDLSQSG